MKATLAQHTGQVFTKLKTLPDTIVIFEIEKLIFIF